MRVLNRRKFVISSGVAALGGLLSSRFLLAAEAAPSEEFEWQTRDMVFPFNVTAGKLRQKSFLPVGFKADGAQNSSGVETALQCSGENSPDPGMKSAMGQPGGRLLFDGRSEEATSHGQRMRLRHKDPVLNLELESIYEGFDGVPVVRRYSR